jgi:hypothetical protein
MILSKCHFNDVKSKKNKIDMHKSEVLKSLKWAMKANIMNKCFTSPRRDDYGKCAMIFFQAWSDMLNTHTCSYIYMLICKICLFLAKIYKACNTYLQLLDVKI